MKSEVCEMGTLRLIYTRQGTRSPQQPLWRNTRMANSEHSGELSSCSLPMTSPVWLGVMSGGRISMLDDMCTCSDPGQWVYRRALSANTMQHDPGPLSEPTSVLQLRPPPSRLQLLSGTLESQADIAVHAALANPEVNIKNPTPISNTH